MQKVKIITERLASLSYKDAQRKGIYIFPANIIYKGDVIKDDNDADAQDFIQKLVNIDEIPSTGVPPLGEIIKAFREATNDCDDAIYISASSKLSGLYNAGLKAAKKLKEEGKDIRVFDSYTVVSMEGMYAHKAAALSNEGKTADEIISVLEKIKKDRRIIEYGVLNTLKYLQKGGRIGRAKAWVSNLFSFKPIISALDGVLEPIAKVRTNQQGLDLIVNKIKDDMKRTKARKISVMYDYGVQDDFIKSEVDPRIREEFDAEIILSNQISSVIACHMGPEIWGVCVLLE